MCDWKWTNAEELCVEGKGWRDTRAFFDRLPARAEGVVRDVIWGLSRKTTGITVGFQTDATDIRARWTLGEDALSANHTPLYAYSGLDLYAKTPAGAWHWVGLARDIAGRSAESPLNFWGPLDGELHEFRVYLPLYNSVENLEFGIPEGAAISTVAPRAEKPVAYYGTSIVHGAGASRPGMTHVSILGRRLNYPILNLGFSGNAIMEPEVAVLLAELDPAAYVLDSLPNMGAGPIAERAGSFIRTLRTARPDTPIVLVEDRTYPAAWLTPQVEAENATRRAAFKQVYAKLLAEEAGPLHYIEGDGLLGMDNDGTNDGSHANDLGASRMADALVPVLRRILGGNGF
jgi:lysophospholipase L1-like esterase